MRDGEAVNRRAHQRGAVVVQSAGEGAGLRPSLQVSLAVVFVEEGRETLVFEAHDLLREKTVIVRRKNLFGLRAAEHQHVLAGLLLNRVLPQKASENRRMRGIDDDELFQVLGILRRKGPRYDAAPVVPDENKSFMAKMPGQRTDVFDQELHLIAAHVGRFGR